MGYILSVILTLLAPVPKDSRDLHNEPIPKEWKIADIEKGIRTGADKGPVSVLVWEVIDSKRGFIIEKALVIKELKDAVEGGDRFVLAYIYRHPKAENPEWRFAVISGTIIRPNGVPVIHDENGVESFTKVPSDADMESLMKRLRWDHSLTADEKHTPELKAGGVIYENWKKVLGREPPVKLFPELKAKK